MTKIDEVLADHVGPGKHFATHNEIAARAGISTRTLYAMRRQVREPKNPKQLRSFRAVAEALGVAVADITEGRDE